MAMIVITGSILHILQVAEAQTPNVVCLTAEGESAPWADAATVVQTLREMGEPCCQSASTTGCTPVLAIGNAVATICGPQGTCLYCTDMGNALNWVLARCNVMNEVQGAYSPDGTSAVLYYITATTF
ncbi:unnamed protein product [Calypogeia fissa]